MAEGELVKLTQLTVLFFCIDELEIPELNNAKTNMPENHEENGTIPPVKTQPSPLHSLLEDI